MKSETPVALMCGILEAEGLDLRRLERELHDGMSQNLVGAAIIGMALREKLKRKSPDEVSDIQQIVDLVQQTMDQARHLTSGLRTAKTRVTDAFTRIKLLDGKGTPVRCSISNGQKRKAK